MSDFNSDEYKLKTDSYSENYDSNQTSSGSENMMHSPNLPDPQKIRKIFAPFMLVISIFVFYKILTWIAHSRQPNENKAVVKAQVVQKQPDPAPQPAVIAQHIPSINEINQIFDKAMSKYNQGIEDRFDKINDMISNQNEKIQEIKSTSADLIQTASSLEKQLDNVADKLHKMTQKPKKAPPPAHKEVYHLKAIIPGRAWLEDSNGNTITVKLGDLVNNSPIELISPSQGLVATSAGEVIQYGANDF